MKLYLVYFGGKGGNCESINFCMFLKAVLDTNRTNNEVVSFSVHS
jgi:hypothetical protein